MNILAARNHKSVNLEIGVPVPGNHLFVLDYIFYFYGNICQGLATSAVCSSLYKYPCRNYDSVCTKVNLKSDSHIAEQLIKTHPEYSLFKQMHLVHSIPFYRFRPICLNNFYVPFQRPHILKIMIDNRNKINSLIFNANHK